MTLGLTLTDLCVNGSGGRVLVQAADLKVPPGTLLGITGASGAGKTTLLHAIAGIVPSEGSIRWGETNFSKLSDHARTAFRARNMGMVFQDFLLFDDLSAHDNARLAAMFAPRAERAEITVRAKQHLSELGLTDPERHVASYSGGERQRVALARALAADPAVVLADEPTAALDRRAADRVIHDLVAACRERGRTLIAISHDTHLLDAMDRVVHVTDGHLAAQVPA
ncbi:putative ABC transport system ATP-binding protein [Sagittula marina]|uniref:Putative ABC transport system ATP-binding protein n=1 Tax=Sagittula marina TaxID=943940 RepID=A0A7W6DJH1_9RHOB|nr:ATP-binding cassette domain-containing protein [Sagittula marina]MBB3983902.1 putative ABC transport system ATP-binding protein [Sagittula marina]